jgi:hypothetical protein
MPKESKVEVVGLDQLLTNLAKKRLGVIGSMVKGVNAAADHLEGIARAWAPNKTGFLEGNIKAGEAALRATAGGIKVRGAVTSNTPNYDRFQHDGGDAKRKIRKYGKGRKGKGFLSDAGDQEQQRIERVIAHHLKDGLAK